VSDSPAVRASDADRERTITVLRDHAAEGRLTLEEFDERMQTALAATTQDQLQALTCDLPVLPAQASSRRKPTRFVGSLFGSTERSGRIRVTRRVTCLSGFGNVDLDLREATFEGDDVTIVVGGVFSSIDVYVPEGIEVDVHGLALFGHKRERGPDSPRPGTPVVHVYAFSLFAAIDVWRVPLELMRRSLDDVIGAIESRGHRELEA
jgi:hypothetical protein